MELRALKTFQVVATHLNQTKAAEILGYTQPSITMQIRNLETKVGHQLFNRVGKKTFLTPAGKLLKEHVDKLLESLGDMERAMNQLNGPYGKLIIAAPEYYWTHFLTLLINTYVKQHPQVKLKIVSCCSAEALRQLINNEADVGIVGGTIKNDEFESVRLDEEDLLLVTSKAIYENNDPAAIYKKFPFIYKDSYNLDGLYNKCLEELPAKPTSVIESSSEEAIKKAVLNDIGIALISEEIILEELRKGDLVPLQRFDQTLETFIVTLKKRSDEITIRSFTELVVEGWDEVGV
ncbi:LysR family transcriptional regulator [Brevibacillus reuszeri]|uniref:LysR family transcriptional regulator n=1 Tax=Brevibacillus reuszeri TaxID=54915 RepID=UPI003D22480E